MINLSNISAAYFIGIGGIGMSALARFLSSTGIQVAGYDRTPSKLTRTIQEEGIEITFSTGLDAIPEWIRAVPKEKLLVVITPAVPKDMPQMKFFQQRGDQLVKRAELLGAITDNMRTVCIAGTHGKTTTTTLTAHLMKHAGLAINAFLGGISVNYNTNLLLDAQSDLAVVEADEYDRSFLQLKPTIAVITAMDPDHLDIYGSGLAMREAFQEFANQVRPGGSLILHKGLKLNAPTGVKLYRYGKETEGCDYFAKDIHVVDGAFEASFVGPGFETGPIRLQLPGTHNVENAVAAVACAHGVGIDAAEIATGLETFEGVQRRFQFIFNDDERVYIDDYAHHPEEIRACIDAGRMLYPQERITGIFQPHLYSRTRDFADDFAISLSALDEVILMEIYPARETPIPGVDSQMLLDKIKLNNKWLLDSQKLLDFLGKHRTEVLLTMGAGSIDQLVEPIKNVLSHA